MADDFDKGIDLVLEGGTAIWPNLNEPDTKWKDEGEYTCKVSWEGDDVALIEKHRAVLEEMAEARLEAEKAALIKAGKKALAGKLKLVPVIKAETDQETGEETGRVFVNPKMAASGVSKKTNKPWKRSPSIFNAAGKKLANPPRIGGGSIVNVSVSARAYYSAKDQEVGISFKLEAVQIIKLVQQGQRSASGFGFSAVDGDDVDDEVDAGVYPDTDGDDDDI